MAQHMEEWMRELRERGVLGCLPFFLFLNLERVGFVVDSADFLIADFSISKRYMPRYPIPMPRLLPRLTCVCSDRVSADPMTGAPAGNFKLELMCEPSRVLCAVCCVLCVVCCVLCVVCCVLCVV
jgi:hypothetical protein